MSSFTGRALHHLTQERAWRLFETGFEVLPWLERSIH